MKDISNQVWHEVTEDIQGEISDGIPTFMHLNVLKKTEETLLPMVWNEMDCKVKE